MRKLTKHLPNTMTLCNVGVGIAAIMLALSGDFDKSAGLIIISVIVDSLDGVVARMVGSTSKLGSYLDTVSDFLSFAVAAGILLVKAFGVSWVIGVLFVLASMARLIIFMRTKTPGCFLGVPTTVAGGFIASVVLIHPAELERPEMSFVMSAVAVLLSLLMLTRKRYYRIEFKKRKTITLILAVLSYVYVLNQSIFFRICAFIFLFYIAFGWLRIREPRN
jgi:CDP-diacylglycerol---serine O-phosphatidyltransferase